MYFLEMLGIKLIQNKQLTIGITTISIISQHIHYILTDTNAIINNIAANKQFPILQSIIAKLTNREKQILLSFFIQSFAFIEPYKLSPSSPISVLTHSPNRIIN